MGFGLGRAPADNENTMQIILKRTKCFIEGQKAITLSPSPDIQTVPEWVRNTATFRLGCQDMSIQEVEVKSAPAAAAVPVEVEPEAPAEEPEPAAPAPRPIQPPNLQGRRK